MNLGKSCGTGKGVKLMSVYGECYKLSKSRKAKYVAKQLCGSL